jgi:heme A synthase
MPKNIKGIRILVMIILALLLFQYEFGMAANLNGPPKLAPFGFSSAKFAEALNQAGLVEMIHADLGTLLPVLSLVGLILSLRSRVRSVQVVGTLAFLAVLLAAISGILFVMSGYQDDHFSHGMATNFILSVVFYFLELYFLKPAPKT